MKNLILILFSLSAYYVLADICKNGEKLKLEDGLFMKCKKNIWKAVEKRAGPGGPPCEDNPTLAANGTCSMQRGDCKQFTKKGLEMDRDCAGTCGSCDTCQCKDNSAWHRFCPFWVSYCSSPGVLGTWMTTNCKKTCGRCRCKCCSYNGKQHSLGAKIPLPDKCGEMVCKEGLVAGSSPLLPGASQHPVSHPEELTLTFTSLHTGAECCVLPVDAVGDNGATVTNGTMVPEGWKGTTNTQHGQIALTCCHGSLQVPLEDAAMIPATSTTNDSTTMTSTTPTTMTSTTPTTTSTTTTTMTSTTTTTTMTSTNTAIISCQPDWSVYESSCFRLFKNAVSFDQAQAACQAEGANLASILNIETTKFVLNLSYPISIWIGGHRSSEWNWVGHGEWAFTNWQPGQPDNPGSENCIEMYSSGRWNNLPCSGYPRTYVCEKIA